MSRADKIAKQIHNFTMEEFLDLKFFIEGRLQELEEQGEEIPVKSGRQVVEEVKEATRTQRREYVRCGKPNCKCAEGELHGPYWYEYWKEDGRSKSIYLGKKKKRKKQT